MLTPERHDDLRAENERLKKLLDDACNDEEELHARIDAILGKEVIDPPGTGRTPLAGDDGRLAVLLTALKAAWAERDYWRDAPCPSCQLDSRALKCVEEQAARYETLAARLAEAERLLRPFATCASTRSFSKCHGGGTCSGCRAAAFLATAE